MKKIQTIILILSLSPLFCFSCEKENPTGGYNIGRDTHESTPQWSGTVDLSGFDYSGLTASNHPRILMKEADFSALKKRLVTEDHSSALYKLHSECIESADKIVAAAGDDKLVYKLDASGIRILDNVARPALRRLFNCAYAYKLTSDQKYLNKVEADLRNLCEFDDWNTRRHILDGGEIGTGVAMAYDWLYNDLDPELRTLVRTKIVDYLLRPVLQGQYNENPFTQRNNRNHVVGCGLSLCALAVWEDAVPEASAILEKAVRGNMTGQTAVFYPDGNSPEGYVYCNYAQSFEALLLGALESTVGSDAGLSAVPGFSRSQEYLMYMTGINNQIFNYADAGGTSSQASPGAWYIAVKFSDPSVLYYELKTLDAGMYEMNRLLPMTIPFAMKLNLNEISHPASDYWYGQGAVPVYLIHTKWTFGVEDKYVGFKGGSPSESHSHMDGGSFVYDAAGVRWALDLGMQQYASVESLFKSMGGSLGSAEQNSLRWTLARLNSRYHNTLTFDGDDHLVTGKAVIMKHVEKSDVISATMRLSSFFKQTKVAYASRTVELVNNEDFYVIDSVTTVSSTKMRWNMVTDALPAIDTVKNVVTLEKGAVLNVKPVCDNQDVRISVYKESANEGLRDYDFANPGKYMIGYTADIPANVSVVFKTKLSLK